MIQYQVFKKDYQKGEEILLGILTERRESQKNLPAPSSALKWARTIFGRIVKDPHSIFITMGGNQKGASSSGYALGVFLIAIVIIVGISAFGNEIRGLFESFNSVWPK